jgi:hypothetical protein
MSVDRTDYIIYGWKLPYELENSQGTINVWEPEFDSYREGRIGEKYRIIADGMCGDYIVFGQQLSSTSADDSWDFIPLNFSLLKSDEIKQKYKELFEIDEEIEEPSLFIFSHFH